MIHVLIPNSHVSSNVHEPDSIANTIPQHTHTHWSFGVNFILQFLQCREVKDMTIAS